MPAAPTRPDGCEGVVIAIDAHKASWTAVAVDTGLTRWPRCAWRSTGPATGSCVASRPGGHTRGGRSKERQGWVRR